MTDTVQPEPEKKPPLKVRLKKLIADYGNVAIVTYLLISLVTIIIFTTIIALGVGATSGEGILGTIVAGWLAAKVTVPLRILGTLAVTPVLGTWLKRRKIARGEYDDDDDDDLEDEPVDGKAV